MTPEFPSPLLCNVARCMWSVPARTKYCQSALQSGGRGSELARRCASTLYNIILQLTFTGNNSHIHSTMEVFVPLPFLLCLQCLEMCFDCKAFLLPTITLGEFISFCKKLHFVNDWPVIYETNFLKYWVHFSYKSQDSCLCC